MIQELLGGSSASTTCPTSIPILTTTCITTNPQPSTLVNSSNTPSGATNTSQQNLKCPRCDSTNTKFCYYNNYNLTQPRHFCKTCRRYWTKGGTLRNVPIGGGYRKNRPTIANSGSTNAMAKAKASLSTELLVNANPSFLGTGYLDHLHGHPDLNSGYLNPIIWPSVPQNSHILSLLKGSTEFHNPSSNLNPVSNVSSHVNQFGLFQKSNQTEVNGYSSGVEDFVQNHGNNNSNILELYHRLKSSSNYSYLGNENPRTNVLGNMVGSTSPSSPMNLMNSDLDPVRGGDHFEGYGFMNSPAMVSGWSDFPIMSINGALS